MMTSFWSEQFGSRTKVIASKLSFSHVNILKRKYWATGSQRNTKWNLSEVPLNSCDNDKDNYTVDEYMTHN